MRRVRRGALLLLAALALVGVVVALIDGDPALAQTAKDYDVDNDNLIEVSNLEQLNALRWDLDGNGRPLSPNGDAYRTAFPSAISGMGCAATCAGYELAADLDFNDTDSYASGAVSTAWTTGAGWEPIGTTFTTEFNGNGHTISKLFINRTVGNIGLFRHLGAGALVRNLGLVGVNVTGGSSTGALVGQLGDTTVANTEVVHGVYATGRVSGGENVGGLVGTAIGTIRLSWSSVTVTATNQTSGGLVGATTSGDVLASYATGSVTGTNRVGGLVGGVSGAGGSVVASYATGAVTGTGGDVGGLIGEDRSSSGNSVALTANHFDSNTTGRVFGLGSDDDGAGSGTADNNVVDGTETNSLTGQTTSALKTPTGYSGIYADWDDQNVDGVSGNDSPWDFGTASQYPALRVDVDGDGMATVAEFGPQGEKPDAPTGLTLTPASYNIDASWTAPTNTGRSAIEAYKLELEDTGAGRVFEQEIRPAALMTTIGNFELTPNTAYRARVRAVSSVGGGAWSAWVSTTTVADTTTPNFQSAKVRFSTLTIAYDDGLDPNSIPAASTFSVAVGSAAGVAPSSVAVEVAAGVPQVSLTLASPVGYGQTVTLDYTKPTSSPLQNRAGLDVPNISGQSVDNETGPGLSSAAVSGSTLVLTYGQALDEGSVPAASDFHVSYSGGRVTPTGVEVSGTMVTLTLPQIVPSTATATVSYAPGANPIRDAANSYRAATLNRVSVTNNTPPETVPPVLQTAAVTATTLTLTYNEPLDASSVPAAGDFAVTENGATIEVSSVAVSGSEVTLTLAAATTRGRTVRVGYTPGTNPIQDVAGNDAASFSNRAVTNNNNPPTFQSAAVVGTTLTLTYNQALDTASVSAVGDFAVTVGGTAVTVSSVAVSGMTVTLTLAETTNRAQTVRVAYTPGTNPIQNTVGSAVARLSARTVTNNNPPALTTATVNRTSLVLTFNTPLDSGSTPTGSDFTVTATGTGAPSSIAVSTVRVSGTRVTLTLDTPMLRIWTVTVGYTPGANRIQDRGGIEAVAFSGEAVTNNTPADRTRPSFRSAVVEFATLTMTYSEALDAGSTPAPAAFTVTIGGTATAVSSVAVSGTDVTLTLAASAALGDTVRLAYAVPAENPIRDLSGNDASALSTRNVTNNTPANAAPVFGEGATATRSIAENTTGQVNLGAVFRATDADGMDSDIRYGISGPDHASFLYFSQSGRLTTRPGVVYDFEAQPSYTVVLRATDGQGAIGTITVTINLTDENEPPTLGFSAERTSVGPAGTIWIWTPENQARVGRFVFDDPDADDAPRLTLVSGDRGLFSLSDGLLSFRTAPDYETLPTVTDPDPNDNIPPRKTIYRLVAVVTGGAGDRVMTQTRVIYIQVTDVDPEDTTAPTLSTATVNGATLILTYDEPLDGGSTPAPSDFMVTVDTAAATVSSVRVSGSTVILTLAEAVTDAQAVTVDYTVPASGPIQDRAGNDAAAIAAQMVTNNTPTPQRLPGAPTGLQIRPDSNDDGEITVEWTAPADLGEPELFRYRVYYESGDRWLPSVGNATSLRLRYLENGRTYRIRVTAENAAGEGPSSATITARPEAGHRTPGRPTGLTLTGGNGMIRATWTAPSDTGKPALNGYSVQYRELPSGSWTDVSHRGTGRSATITGLTNGTAYEVQVAATNTVGTGGYATRTGAPTGPPSDPAPIPSEATAPGAPTVFTRTGNSGPDQGAGRWVEAKIWWSAPSGPVSGYRLEYRSTNCSGDGDYTTGWLEIRTSATAQTLRVFERTRSMDFQVRAYNGAGDGPLSAMATYTNSGTSCSP